MAISTVRMDYLGPRAPAGVYRYGSASSSLAFFTIRGSAVIVPDIGVNIDHIGSKCHPKSTAVTSLPPLPGWLFPVLEIPKVHYHHIILNRYLFEASINVTIRASP